MCIAGGKDISPKERLFTVIIRGVGNRRYWRFKASLQHDTICFPKRCLFVVVPHKPFDARETLILWRHWHHKLRRQLNRFDSKRSGAHVRKPWLGLALAAQSLHWAKRM
jgi:hypothetical protein